MYIYIYIYVCVCVCVCVCGKLRHSFKTSNKKLRIIQYIKKDNDRNKAPVNMKDNGGNKSPLITEDNDRNRVPVIVKSNGGNKGPGST